MNGRSADRARLVTGAVSPLQGLLPRVPFSQAVGLGCIIDAFQAWVRLAGRGFRLGSRGRALFRRAWQLEAKRARGLAHSKTLTRRTGGLFNALNSFTAIE